MNFQEFLDQANRATHLFTAEVPQYAGITVLVSLFTAGTLFWHPIISIAKRLMMKKSERPTFNVENLFFKRWTALVLGAITIAGAGFGIDASKYLRSLMVHPEFAFFGMMLIGILSFGYGAFYVPEKPQVASKAQVPETASTNAKAVQELLEVTKLEAQQNEQKTQSRKVLA